MQKHSTNQIGGFATVLVNWINGKPLTGVAESVLEKFDPHTGKKQSEVQNSTAADVDTAVTAAQEAYQSWSTRTPVERGTILKKVVQQMEATSTELAEIVATETGKPIQDAEGEVGAAILQGDFFASEGLRLFGRTLSSAQTGKQTFTVRESFGPTALIVPANTPIANLAWKIFPALICGNTVVVKASEDAPQTALYFASLFAAAGLPNGVLNVIHGYGAQCGNNLTSDERIKLISFTGSTAVGKQIALAGGARLVPVSLELGGKNPFIVCADANLDNAVHWALLSCYSNAGQRCAAASRLLVHQSVNDIFLEKFLNRAKKLSLGVERGCDLGPVITSRQHERILSAIRDAAARGGKILCGGANITSQSKVKGYYIEPTLISGLDQSDPLNQEELFGPVASIQTFSNAEEALFLANHSIYGLTSAIHTQNIDASAWFTKHLKHGVVNVNLGTFGSEPQFPFGGFGQSGNGTREPGSEALSVYSQLKVISVGSSGKA